MTDKEAQQLLEKFIIAEGNELLGKNWMAGLQRLYELLRKSDKAFQELLPKEEPIRFKISLPEPRDMSARRLYLVQRARDQKMSI